KVLIPASPADVEKEGARGVRRVGCVDSAAGEAEDQPAVDRPEEEPSALSSGACARDMIEDEGELGPGEIGVEAKPSPFLEDRSQAGARQFLALCCGPPVLPRDRRRHGVSGFTIPDDRGLALVRNSDGGDGAA